MSDDAQSAHSNPKIRAGKIHAAGKLAARVLDEVGELVKPGATTDDLNAFCDTMIREAGAVPGAKEYKGFPKSICTSVNHVAVHGVPGDQELQEGDVIKIDACVKMDGVFADNCRTYFVGKPSKRAEKVTIAAYNALVKGIEQMKPGNTLWDVGTAIKYSLKDTGYSVLTGLWPCHRRRAAHEAESL